MKKEFEVVRALLPFLRLYPWAVPTIIALGVLSSFAEGIGISLFIPLLQSLEQASQSRTGNQWVDTLGQLFRHVPAEHRLLVICLCISGAILLKASVAYGNGALMSWWDARIGNCVRSRIFKQLLAVSSSFLERSESGNLWNVLSTETWRTSQALSILLNLIIMSCTVAVYITLLLLISWKLTLLVSVVMWVIATIVARLTRRVKLLGKKATRANAALATRMIEGFAGMKIIRAFGRESYEQERFERASERVSKVFLKLGLIQGGVNPVYEVLAGALLVSILFITLDRSGSLPTLLVFIFVLYRLQPLIKGLDGARVGLNSLSSSVEEVTSLLDRSNKPFIVSGETRFERLEKGIFFERASFSYGAGGKRALENVSFTIPAGKTTALVGPSGAGKSTLINLIFRFYEVTEGEIFIDDHPLRELDLAAWRGRIAMVSQDIHLFNTSVRENIAYGRLDASDEEIIAAARQADAHKFICDLPSGYSTKVGGGGVRLSGGQQQRITLARAIVRNPEVLILDEATNALDSISEHMVQEALDTLSGNRTILVIAHRLSTIERADHIIVLEEGRLREQGSFQELLQLDGLFTRLYNLEHRRSLA